MKEEVLHGLLVARTLFDTARVHCFVRDRHVASAGLIVLQDAIELVLYSCLLEIGADEEKAIEQFSFDQLIGELRQRRLPIIKSGTLKAMNKQRVLIKHHAQLAEPAAVRQYYRASALATDHLLQHVIGKRLQHIVVAEGITTSDLALHINDAIANIDNGQYFEGMIATRKALFLAVESKYDIRDWSEHDPNSAMPRLLLANKAPFHTRNRTWIQQNVAQLTDYVQLDHDRIGIEMLEIGIDPVEFFNVWRLTPEVYYHSDHGWAVSEEPGDEAAATEDNARYCLDVVVSIIRNQQSRKDVIRTRPFRQQKVRLLRDQPLLTRAAHDAPLEGRTLAQGAVYDVRCLVSGLDGSGRYAAIFHFANEPPTYFSGYLPIQACDIEDG